MDSLSLFLWARKRRLQGHQESRAGTQIQAFGFPAWVLHPPCLPCAFQPQFPFASQHAVPGKSLWQSLSWVKSPCGCVGTKACNLDLMGLATPSACELFAEENPATNCSVGLGCIWRVVVRPEQTSLSADLFSG